MTKPSSILKLANLLVSQSEAFLEKHGTKNFHHEARELLTKSSLARDFSYHELVESTLGKAFKTEQNFRALEFSDLPITLARRENCFLDLYFWRRRPTVIHNHHFCGAFQCLEGANIDLQYKFKKQQALGRFHSIGKLELIASKRLQKGDTQSIDFQDKFIHQNHHQSDLTVNLCLRTTDMKGKNLANFLFSGLRYEKDPYVLSRVQRLWRFTSLVDADFKTLCLSSDEMLCFLIETYGNQTQNVKFRKLRDFISKKTNSELGVSIDKMIAQHDDFFDQILEQYE